LRTGQRFLVVANFHGRYALEDVQIQMPRSAWDFLAIARGSPARLKEQLGACLEMEAESSSEGIHVGTIAPLTAYYFSIEGRTLT
jgi:hypothetical protein